MKILIVGGAGYIGGALTDILKDTNHKILIYDLLLYEEYYLSFSRERFETVSIPTWYI